MAKPNAFVKVSGNLIQEKKVLDWIKTLSHDYFVAICAGGGTQINQAFQEKNFEVNFGPLGRITNSLAEKQLARDVLEKNQALLQDLADAEGIYARVCIPVIDIATVLCHVNGDVLLLAAYNGFDKIFILTLESRVKEKEEYIAKLARCFSHTEKGELDKITVIGF